MAPKPKSSKSKSPKAKAKLSTKSKSSTVAKSLSDRDLLRVVLLTSFGTKPVTPSLPSSPYTYPEWSSDEQSPVSPIQSPQRTNFTKARSDELAALLRAKLESNSPTSAYPQWSSDGEQSPFSYVLSPSSPSSPSPPSSPNSPTSASPSPSNVYPQWSSDGEQSPSSYVLSPSSPTESLERTKFTKARSDELAAMLKAKLQPTSPISPTTSSAIASSPSSPTSLQKKEFTKELASLIKAKFKSPRSPPY